MPSAHSPSEQASLRATRNTAIANTVMMTLQIATGWLTGSHAIVADGIHTLVDLVVDALLFLPLHPGRGPLAAWLAGRAAWLPAVAAAALPILAGSELIWHSLANAESSGTKAASAQTIALCVALLVVATRGYAARHLSAAAARIDAVHARIVDALRAGATHALADAISAAAAAVGAVGTMTGIAHLDRMAALLIGAMMLGMGLLQEDGLVRRYCRRVRARPA
ncbi:cation transporter [Paraburkholderia sp. B3]|uniref:cation transporter n=1 Tax=Paraburkholderia sp. B3 TaxID=3134791 RepID=UPI003981EC0E